MSLDVALSVGCSYLCRALPVLSAAFVVHSRGVVAHRLIRYHIRMLYIIYSLDSGNCC